MGQQRIRTARFTRNNMWRMAPNLPNFRWNDRWDRRVIVDNQLQTRQMTCRLQLRRNKYTIPTNVTSIPLLIGLILSSSSNSSNFPDRYCPFLPKGGPSRNITRDLGILFCGRINRTLPIYSTKIVLASRSSSVFCSSKHYQFTVVITNKWTFIPQTLNSSFVHLNLSAYIAVVISSVFQMAV